MTIDYIYYIIVSILAFKARVVKYHWIWKDVTALSDLLVIVGNVLPQQYQPVLSRMKNEGSNPSVESVSYAKWLGCRLSANNLISQIEEIKKNLNNSEYSSVEISLMKANKIHELTENFQGYFGFDISDVQGCVESVTAGTPFTFCETVLSAQRITNSRIAKSYNFIAIPSKRKLKIRIN